MLPINDTVKIDGVKYHIEDTALGYLITGPDTSFIVYDSKGWKSADEVDPRLFTKVVNAIEDLIWFRANGA